MRCGYHWRSVWVTPPWGDSHCCCYATNRTYHLHKQLTRYIISIKSKLSFMHVVQGYNQKFTPGDSFPNLPPYRKLTQKYIVGLVEVFVTISECMEHILVSFSSLINPFMIVINITMSCIWLPGFLWWLSLVIFLLYIAEGKAPVDWNAGQKETCSGRVQMQGWSWAEEKPGYVSGHVARRGMNNIHDINCSNGKPITY